ncbi:MAG TPA: SET domain-containing protein [Patescibacteria group bacterium]
MKTILPSTKIYLSKSTIPNAGRGVFANQDIKAGQVIEICPVIEFPKKDLEHLRQTILRNYYFQWGKGNETVAACLGFGSLYNHSYEPNATYMKHWENATIHFNAIKDIAKDEEITVNYNHGDPNDKSPLWIEDIPKSE